MTVTNRMAAFAVLVALMSNVASAGNPAIDGLPNTTLTPGAVDLAITAQNIKSTVCVAGYTKTVRPPAQYTNQLKRKQLALYHYANVDPKQYEEDHLIPLSVGGNPRDAKNLWPEPRFGEWSAARKDELEFVMYKKLCAGKVTLKAAQDAFREDWVAAYKKYVTAKKGKIRRGGSADAA